MSIFLSFFGIHPTSFFCTIYCIEFWIFVSYSILKTFTVYQTLAISPLVIFWASFWVFFVLNSILYWGGTVSNRPGLFQLGSPVRFSPSRFHIGIYLVETISDLVPRGTLSNTSPDVEAAILFFSETFT